MKNFSSMYVLLILVLPNLGYSQQAEQLQNSKFPSTKEVSEFQSGATQKWIPANSNEPSQYNSQRSNYSAKDYQTASNNMQVTPQQLQQLQQNSANPNGLAPLPAPVMSQDEVDFQEASKTISPFSSDQIKTLRKQLDGTRRATAYKTVRTIPKISSISVNLSPGASLPILRTLPGETSTIVFLDVTGAAWPLAASPRISDGRLFSVEWLESSSSVVVSSLTQYDEGNLTVFLKGLATPIIVKLTTGEPDSMESNRVVDYRLDIRVPVRGPNAKPAYYESGQIALYDKVMQDFLDGVPPANAKLIKLKDSVSPARAKVWELDGYIYIRTRFDIQTAFDQSIASSDGTKVYKLSKTPYITLSVLNKYVMLPLDI